jgi:hypothetical protein
MMNDVKWVTYTCTCGFKLEHVPNDVVEDLPRCLGCGRSLRAPPGRVGMNRLTRVRDLR